MSRLNMKHDADCGMTVVNGVVVTGCNCSRAERLEYLAAHATALRNALAPFARIWTADEPTPRGLRYKDLREADRAYHAAIRIPAPQRSAP